MKYRLLFLVLLLTSSWPLAAQVERLVLTEEFTNASCGPCASQNPAFDALLQSNSDKIISIKYHTSWPGTDPMYSHNPAEATARVNYYGVTGVPHARLDGPAITGPNYVGAPANCTQAIIDAASAILSPFVINLSHSKSPNNDSIYVSMTIKAVQAVSGTLVAHIGVMEKTIEFASPPGSNGETEFSNVMIKMLPDASGTPLPAFNTGDSVVITQSWAFNNVYDHNQVCVVGWVQDNASKNVKQAAYSPPIGPAYLNATPMAILEPGSLSCSNSITPKITLKNMGGFTLNSLEINYSVNGGTPQVHPWTGTLYFLDQTEVTLPAITFNMLPTNNILTIWTSSPNGGVDSIPSDDTLTMMFNQSATVGTPLTLDLKTDQYPDETTWKLFNASGSVVAQGGPYTGQPNTLIQVPVNLTSSECYDFVIYDAYGDGICCNYGNGYYKLKDNNNIVFIQGGQFGSSELTPFMEDISFSTPEVELISDFEVFPNPFDNTATISLYLARDMNLTLIVMNEVGQVVYSMDKVIMKAGNHTIDLNGETWTPGIYFVKLLTGDSIITKKLSLTK